MDPNLYEKNPALIFNDAITDDGCESFRATNENNVSELLLPEKDDRGMLQSSSRGFAQASITENIDDAAQNLDIKTTTHLQQIGIEMSAASNSVMDQDTVSFTQLSADRLNEKPTNSIFNDNNNIIDFLNNPSLEFMYEEKWDNEEQQENHHQQAYFSKRFCGFSTLKVRKIEKKFTDWAYKHPWLILICLCYVSMVCTMTGIGFLGVVIQDIEKQYGLSSTHTGFISACLDVAFCFGAILIGWKLKKSDLGFISLGMGAVTLGCLLFALPLAVIRTDINIISTNNTAISESLCFTKENLQRMKVSLPIDNRYSKNNKPIISKDHENRGLSNSYRALIIFYAAFALIGIGSAPVFILSPIILKNMLSESRRSTYLSIFYLSSLLGPSLAYFSSNPILKIPVFLKPISNTDEFIGAWWICFVFGGIASFVGFIIISIIAILFNPSEQENPVGVPSVSYNSNLGNVPDNVSSRSSQNKHKKLTQVFVRATKNSFRHPLGIDPPSKFEPLSLLEPNDHNLKGLKTFGKLRLIISNNCYLLVSFSSTLIQFLIVGFATFLPKFMENNFTILPERAVIIVGFIMVPSAALGSIVGGFLIRKFKLRLPQICFLCFVCSLVTTVATFCFLIQCPPVTNVTPSYSSLKYPHSSIINIEKCWSQCAYPCEDLPSQPVCYQDKNILFLNPCYAGCRSNKLDNNQTVYFDCSCIEENNSFSTKIILTVGSCSLYCNQIIFFSVVMFLLNFFMFTMYVPMTEVTMRVVRGNLLTMALGFQQVLQRLLGQVPGPIIIGKLIDLACVYWKTKGSESHCFVYDTVKYRIHMTSIGVPVFLVNTLCMFTAYVFSSRENLEVS